MEVESEGHETLHYGETTDVWQDREKPRRVPVRYCPWAVIPTPLRRISVNLFKDKELFCCEKKAYCCRERGVDNANKIYLQLLANENVNS